MLSDETETELDPLRSLPEGFLTGTTSPTVTDALGSGRYKANKKTPKSSLKTTGPPNKRFNRVSFSPGSERISFENGGGGSGKNILTPIREAVAGFFCRADDIIPDRRVLRRSYSYSYSIIGHYKYNKLGFSFICISVALLAVSSVLFFVAFFTNSWGIIEVEQTGESLTGERRSYKWNFGLWMCCRNDRKCIGLTWPAFYSITRLFAVFSLFGHIFTLAWLIGHTIEKLLRYDLCTMVSLVGCTIATCVCSMVSVITFGLSWQNFFSANFSGITSIHESYSFYLAILTVPLTFLTSVTLIVDLQSEWRIQEMKSKFGPG